MIIITIKDDFFFNNVKLAQLNSVKASCCVDLQRLSS